MVDEQMLFSSPVIRVRAGESSYEQDTIAVEQPIALAVCFQKGNQWITQSLGVTMRTPGKDDELLRGFLFSESIIDQAADIESLSYEAGDVPKITARVPKDISKRLEGVERSGYRNASCGFCGSENFLPEPSTQLAIDRTVTVAPEIIHHLAETLSSAQAGYQATGGLHATALFSLTGSLIAVCEDIGRHNALDKLAGLLLGQAFSGWGQSILFLSGRVSYEMIQKAIRMQVPIVVAVGAPSSLAIEMAYRHGITLLGFSKNERFNIYTFPERLKIS